MFVQIFLDMIQIILFILANKHTHIRNLFGTHFNYNESSRKKLEKSSRKNIHT